MHISSLSHFTYFLPSKSVKDFKKVFTTAHFRLLRDLAIVSSGFQGIATFQRLPMSISLVFCVCLSVLYRSTDHLQYEHPINLSIIFAHALKKAEAGISDDPQIRQRMINHTFISCRMDLENNDWTEFVRFIKSLPENL